MDLSTRYLGLDLRCPLMAGASPLADDLDTVRRLEDAGAGAIVLRSLFEEQIEAEFGATHEVWHAYAELSPEAQSVLPSPPEYAMGPEHYLEHLRRVKDAVDVPVIASLNGTTAAGWLHHASRMAQAGADALELNVDYVASDPRESAAAVEQRVLDVVSMVKAEVPIPVAVKLSPFYSALGSFAAAIRARGADGLVLFNRLYHPDIDPEALDVVPRLHLSTPEELPLRLHWLAILSGRFDGSLACSGGVHGATDAVRAIMAGADAVQLVSALLKHGPGHLGTVIADVVRWMEEREYESVRQMRGSMNLARCPDPSAFERVNYMRILSSWRSR